MQATFNFIHDEDFNAVLGGGPSPATAAPSLLVLLIMSSRRALVKHAVTATAYVCLIKLTLSQLSVDRSAVRATSPSMPALLKQ
jgi:hypothetical protein